MRWEPKGPKLFDFTPLHQWALPAAPYHLSGLFCFPTFEPLDPSAAGHDFYMMFISIQKEQQSSYWYQLPYFQANQTFYCGSQQSKIHLRFGEIIFTFFIFIFFLPIKAYSPFFFFFSSFFLSLFFSVLFWSHSKEDNFMSGLLIRLVDICQKKKGFRINIKNAFHAR